MSPPDRNRPAHLQLVAVAWNFGWPVAAGVVLGHWIDESLGTSPAATLAMGIGAMAAATWRLLNLSKQEAAERREEEAAHPPRFVPPTATDPGADPAAGDDPWGDDGPDGEWDDDSGEEDRAGDDAGPDGKPR